MRFNSIEDAIRSYWRHEVCLTNLVMTLLTDFDTKILVLRERDCSLFDMRNQEHLYFVRPSSRLGKKKDRLIKAEIETFSSEDTDQLLRQAATVAIDGNCMHELGIDVERSVFSLQVEHLAYLPAE